MVRFNPTRVRLKGTAACRRAQRAPSFNPTRVCLKESGRVSYDELEPLQPHKGSSERNRGLTPPVSLICFNPTRVRLKARSLVSRDSRRGSFNPTRVRLKDDSALPLGNNARSFNPTRVRLKGGSRTRSPMRPSFNPTRVRLKEYSRRRPHVHLRRGASTPQGFV